MNLFENLTHENLNLIVDKIQNFLFVRIRHVYNLTLFSYVLVYVLRIMLSYNANAKFILERSVEVIQKR